MNAGDKGKNLATIAFTLPISCQICLGKVKQPVVCSNQHVFCGTCMEVWLQRNQQCPTCRVTISSENPIRQVLGGLSSQVEEADKFSNRELRRARMELLYKDYEELIVTLEAELEAARQENKELAFRVKTYGIAEGKSSAVANRVSSPPDKNMIALLNDKIKDATALYEKVKDDLQKLKEENAVLKNKNIDLSRENQTLRLELANRSPRRHGRFTVAALENRCEASEKQVKQLEKALEKTDAYIEGLEKELEHFRKGSKPDKKSQSKKDSFDLDSTINTNDSESSNGEMPSRISTISDDTTDYRFRDTGKKKRLERSFDLDSSGVEKSSFALELPSPMTTVDSNLLDDTTEGSDGSFLGLKGKGKVDSAQVDVCKKKLRFTLPEAAPKSGILKTDIRPSIRPNSALDQDALPETNILNVSLTPEMEDCMRLMDEAEKKLEHRRQYDPKPPSMFGAVSSSMTANQQSAPPFGSLFPQSSTISKPSSSSTLPATSFPLTFHPSNLPSASIGGSFASATLSASSRLPGGAQDWATSIPSTTYVSAPVHSLAAASLFTTSTVKSSLAAKPLGSSSAMMMGANSLSQPSHPPVSFSIPGFSSHLSQ